MYCKHCGNKMDDDALFCTSCGCRKDAEEKALYCEKCGTKISDGALFCTTCGNKLVTEQVVATPETSEKKDVQESTKMSIRKAALIKCIYQFILFSTVGLVILMLFRVIALPVIAFMWTFWLFNLLTLIIGIQIKKRYKISFALLTFFIIALLIALLLFR